MISQLKIILIIGLLACCVAAQNPAVDTPESRTEAGQPGSQIHGPHNWAANLKFLGLTFHPGGGPGDYPTALDSAGYLVLQVGLEGDLDYYLHKYLILRASTSLYKDCAFLWSGFFHLGPRVNLPIGPAFAFRIGIGPTVIWRENWWKHVGWYNGDLFYGKQETNGAIHTAFLWYGGNLECEYRLRNNTSLVFSMVPGWPQVFTNSFGMRRYF